MTTGALLVGTLVLGGCALDGPGLATGPASGEHPTSAATPRRPPSPESPRAVRTPRTPAGDTRLVARVVDGDTLELGNGDRVRLLGMDTPEVGACGYEEATRAMERLVAGRRVRLVRAGENRDGYDRLLRYVDVTLPLGAAPRRVDAGLAVIRRGLAVARYDSRDGYGAHPRERRYVQADQRSPDRCSRPVTLVPPSSRPAQAGCAQGYRPCVPVFPPDVDCADVDGPVRVSGPDPHGLDQDGDGVACE